MLLQNCSRILSGDGVQLGVELGGVVGEGGEEDIFKKAKVGLSSAAGMPLSNP